MTTNYNSTANQTIKAQFVQREVYTNVGSMVEYILSKSHEEMDENIPFTWDDVENYYPDNEDEIEEIQERIDNLEELDEITEDVEIEIEQLQEKIEELEEEQESPTEIYEWHVVSNWLCEKLAEKGECVISHENLWGRCCTGQAILLDSVISEICHDLKILEGQENDWSK